MSRHPYTPHWRNGLRHADAAPRCHARCKHSKRPCKAPAVRGCRGCRMRGARGGGPLGAANGAYRHGRATKEVKRLRSEAVNEPRRFRELIREAEELCSVLAMDDEP
jgi:hypothetical protein